ncbi:MAG TPA: hypothetical protein PLV92_24330, partial [Pirellulaceae bacterium]|nr:hypothetical protein [Pirellulaceae bacterium]
MSFTSGGNVDISEDSSTLLAGANSAANVRIASSGGIADATATTVAVSGAIALIAGGDIALNDSAGDVLTSGGTASFNATNVLVATAGDASLDGVTFVASGGVDISLDAALVLRGTNSAGSVRLASASGISDATNATLSTSGGLTLVAIDAVSLADEASNEYAIGGAVGISGASIAIGSAGTTTFGAVTFQATGEATIYEDSNLLLAGASAASTLGLFATGAITDAAGASVTTSGAASFTATGDVSITDNPTDNWSVGGLASFVGSTLTIASNGTANFDSLSFSATGAATIYEDSATVLGGSNSAASLLLSSAGAIADLVGADLSVGGDATLTSAGTMDLTDDATNDLVIGGALYLNGAALTLASPGQVSLSRLNLQSTGAANI